MWISGAWKISKKFWRYRQNVFFFYACSIPFCKRQNYAAKFGKFLHFKKGLASVSHDKRIAHIWPIVSEGIMTMHSLLEILKGQVILHEFRQRFQKILKVQSCKLKNDW